MAQFTVVRKLAVEVEWFFMITIHDPKMRVDSINDGGVEGRVVSRVPSAANRDSVGWTLCD
jgi:hypothetical protein